MGEFTELKLTIEPLGDTEAREVVDLTTGIRKTLEGIQELSDIRPVSDKAPLGAKVGEVAAVGALLIAIAPAAIEGALNIIRDVLSRSGKPSTKVTIVNGETSVEIEFNPKTITPAEMADLVERIAPRTSG